MNRRMFLSSLFSLYFGNKFVVASDIPSNSDKSCILIYLHGGIAAQEFSHANPYTIEPQRSTVGYVDTGLGYHLGGTFSGLASRAKKITNVLSYGHNESDHGKAAALVLTGVPQPNLIEAAATKEPCIGSIISNVLGDRNKYSIPNYVKVNKIEFAPGGRRDTAGWLIGYDGFDVDQDGLDSLKPNSPITKIDERLHLIELLEKDESSWGSLRRKAYNTIIGKAYETFDLSNESQENQNKFKIGSSQFGKSLLIAKRLVEKSVKFVSVSFPGWDMHWDIKKNFEVKGRELDWGLSLLIDELEKSNLLDKTLLIITTEFGRTKINKDEGRDHQPGITSLIFAGGGFEHGKTIGSVSKDILQPTSQKFGPQDLLWTIGSYFDLNKNLTLYDRENRPHHIFQENSISIL